LGADFLTSISDILDFWSSVFHFPVFLINPDTLWVHEVDAWFWNLALLDFAQIHHWLDRSLGRCPILINRCRSPLDRWFPTFCTDWTLLLYPIRLFLDPENLLFLNIHWAVQVILRSLSVHLIDLFLLVKSVSWVEVRCPFEKSVRLIYSGPRWFGTTYCLYFFHWMKFRIHRCHFLRMFECYRCLIFIRIIVIRWNSNRLPGSNRLIPVNSFRLSNRTIRAFMRHIKSLDRWICVEPLRLDVLIRRCRSSTQWFGAIVISDIVRSLQAVLAVPMCLVRAHFI